MNTRLKFLYITSFILLILIVVLAIQNINKTNEEIEEEKEDIILEIGTNISLLRSETGQVEQIDLNDYLFCVVASEIPFNYEYEAIKAQVVVARTYLYNKIINNTEENADVCDNYAHCQAFNEVTILEEKWRQKGFTEAQIQEGETKIKQAIVDTQGQIITYNGEIIDALFHASSPNGTEDASAIWSEIDVPYLKAVENIEDEDYENRTSQEVISYVTFKNILIENGYIDKLTKDDFLTISIGEYTNSGRVKNIRVGQYSIKAEVLRTLFNIKSTDFNISITEDSITFNVTGYGHGVGLSQVGANTYAKLGTTYDEIIYHYYTGVEIVNEYEVQMKEARYEN